MYTAKGRLDMDAMLRQYSPLVRRLAHQMIAKLPANVEVDDLIQHGRDLEKIVLSRAVRWHLDNRVLVYANKTVIFS